MEELKLLEIKPLVDIKIIKESLNRMGIANKKKRVLYPSCYLYERENEFFLVHFKEMFLLTRENAYNSICEDDILRKNAIAFCLKNWNLIEVNDEDIEPHNKMVFVLPFSEKKNWIVSHKFNTRTINS